MLHDKGVRHNFRINRLVALAFIPNPNNYPTVNHKDENPSNNYFENLEWCTNKYNVNYGTGINRRSQKQKNKSRIKMQRGNHSQAIKAKYQNIVFDCIKDLADYLKIDYDKFKHYTHGYTYIPKYLQGQIQIQNNDGSFHLIKEKIREGE